MIRGILFILTFVIAIIAGVNIWSEDFCNMNQNTSEIGNGWYITDKQINANGFRYLISHEDYKFKIELNSLEKYFTGNSFSLDFSKLKVPENKGYRNYLRNHMICYQINESAISSKDLGIHKGVDYYLDEIRTVIKNTFTTNLSLESASLYLGAVTGETSLFSTQLKSTFQNLGISHLVAVSGSNFASIYLAGKFLTQLLEKKSRLLLIGILLISFIAIVGIDNGAAMRAFIFIFIEIIFNSFGQYLDRISKLAISFFVLTIINPIIWLDLGFQLSITAYLLMRTVLAMLLKNMNHGFSPVLDEIVTSSLGTIILLPVSLIFFDKVNLVSIFANATLAGFFGFMSIIGLGLIFFFLFIPYQPSILTNIFEQFTNFITSIINFWSSYEISVDMSSYQGVSLIGISGFIYIIVFIKLYRQSKTTYERFF